MIPAERITFIYLVRLESQALSIDRLIGDPSSRSVRPTLLMNSVESHPSPHHLRLFSPDV